MFDRQVLGRAKKKILVIAPMLFELLPSGRRYRLPIDRHCRLKQSGVIYATKVNYRAFTIP